MIDPEKSRLCCCGVDCGICSDSDGTEVSMGERKSDIASEFAFKEARRLVCDWRGGKWTADDDES